MKLCRSGEKAWELLWAASIQIVENNGIGETIEKRSEFLPKVTGVMSKDPQSENVQMAKDELSENVSQSLKIILHPQSA